MNGLGILIGSIVMLIVGLWIVLNVAEFVLMLIGWLLLVLGVVGAIKWFMSRGKADTGTRTTNI